MTARPELPALFNAFVTYARADEGLYSCGMHNIGYPDVVIAGDLPVNDAGPVGDRFDRGARVLAERRTQFE